MSYDIILITALLLTAYFLSYALYRKKIIKKLQHNRIWDIIFLISFLLSVGMGMLLAGLADLGLNISLGPDINYWHRLVGIVFLVALVFHLQINWKTFIKLLTRTPLRSKK
jgi:hypothetical protein